ncbi:hypothetical protein ACFY9S_00850 [Streptomyces sp. NPDC012474]
MAIVPGTLTAALDMADFFVALTHMKPEWADPWTALPTRRSFFPYSP